jgi:two-component system LytT family response regulator
MKQISCIIVEDEPLAMERMLHYVAKVPFLSLQAHFDSGIDALVYLKQHSVDLLLLDVNTGEVTGVHLAEQLSKECAIVFTTAYPEFAIKGFELNITDYLLKPFTFDRFYSAMERVQQSLSSKIQQIAPTSLFVKTEYRLEKIAIDTILYIEGMGDYRRIHTPTKRIMTLQTFKELEVELELTRVVRIHKSYMVNVNNVESIERERVSIAGQLLPISDTYKEMFYQRLHK